MLGFEIPWEGSKEPRVSLAWPACSNGPDLLLMQGAVMEGACDGSGLFPPSSHFQTQIHFFHSEILNASCRKSDASRGSMAGSSVEMQSLASVIVGP